MNLWPQIQRALYKVEKPSRYINHELNSVRKEVAEGGIRIALAYPDTYEVGLPNMGLQILYGILNRLDDVAAERVYAPWTDMESIMRERGIPLFSLETHSRVADFDVLGFSLQHELIYTNVLNMLDLAGIPIFAADRDGKYPLIIAGGPGTVNPEPLAPFFDLFVIGEAEELILELVDTLKEWKKNGQDGKLNLLRRLSGIPGIYVPSFYEVSYSEDGLVRDVRAEEGAPEAVTRRIVKDLSKIPVPMRPIVPFMDAVHDRCSVEVMRGCTRGCRFCQAGIIYRPVRERTKEQITSGISRILEGTGYEEISLSSLSSTDYTQIEDVLKSLSDAYTDQGISISLPSLRADAFSVKLIKEIAKVKRTGLTFAPEAGTQRLRDVINKNVTEEDILSTVKLAFEEGWQRIKLYFMIGLPTEGEDDLQGIVDIARKVVDVGLKTLEGPAKSRLMVVVSVSAFVPKPQTPFQWVSQDSLAEFEEKQRFLFERLKGKHLSYKWHNAKSSVIEGAIARGDRRIADVIYRAWQLGCKLDAWTKEFKFQEWMQAFSDVGLDPVSYTQRARAFDEVLPWQHIDTGIDKEFLEMEYERALEAELTGDCRFDACNTCGVCQNLDADNVLFGNAGTGTLPVQDPEFSIIQG
ncbi:MAG TPA: TIGR03960 family B12-binding radical SAM protein [Anaerolineae bacterium]|nr:TIGR03960 family B12-binding radical SAM protein [Anaerolineae bacterium]